MRSIFPTVLVIGLLLVLCFCSACTSQSPPQTANETAVQTTTPAGNAGLTQLNSGNHAPVSLGYADMRLRNEMKSYGDAVGKLHVYFIEGNDIDDSGNAASWVFGVGSSPDNTMILFDGNTWTTTSYGGSLSSEEISLSGVVDPATLFSQNQQAINGMSPPKSPVPRSLVLSDGVYTLRSDKTMLTFNASTGTRIS
jgi:hypothetical protein